MVSLVKKTYVVMSCLLLLTTLWYNWTHSLLNPSICRLKAPLEARLKQNVIKLLHVLEKQPMEWFAHGGHVISALRVGSPVMFFDKQKRIPVHMDVDIDFQIIVPNQTYWIQTWGPLMNQLGRQIFGSSVHFQSKIYPKNSYKIFQFCPTNKRTINPLGHGAGNSCLAEMRPLFRLNQTHVTTKQQCTTPPTKKGPCLPKHIFPLKQIKPFEIAKYGSLQLPVPRKKSLILTLDLESKGQETSQKKIYLWDQLFSVSDHLKSCHNVHYCPVEASSVEYYNEVELRRELHQCQLYLKNFARWIE